VGEQARKEVLEELEDVPEDLFQSISSSLTDQLESQHYPEFIAQYATTKEKEAQPPRARSSTLDAYQKLIASKNQKLFVQDPDKPFLEEIWSRSDLLICFRKFLYRRHSEETLQFVIEAELYSKTTDPGERKKMAERIWERYCKGGAERSINVDASVCENIRRQLPSPTSTTFEVAQKEIQLMMKKDLWPSFLKSDFYSPSAKKKPPQLSKKKIKRSDTLQKYEMVRKLQKHSRDPKALPKFDDIFVRKELMTAFRDYLYNRKAQENLSFTLDAELYTYITSEEELKQKSKELFERYIDPESTQSVNLSDKCRTAINMNIDQPTPAIFANAVTEVTQYLKNWFTDFINSKYFTDIKRKKKLALVHWSVQYYK